VLAFFAALNLIPAPPGTSLILGLPIVFVAAGLLFGHRSVWLPQRIATHVITHASYNTAISRLLPWLTRLERVLKPRYWPFGPVAGPKFIGAVCLILGIIVVFPIPLGNAGPALAATLLGLSLSERDGIWLATGLLTAVAATLLAGSIVAGAAYAASTVWHLGN
jgi:hypothetical protein